MREHIERVLQQTQQAWSIKAMSTPNRTLFVVTKGGHELLVRAVTKQQARRFIADQMIQVRLASQDDLERLIGAGVRPINADTPTTATSTAGNA